MIRQENERLQAEVDEERRRAAMAERQTGKLQQHLDAAKQNINSKPVEARRVSFGENSLDDAPEITDRDDSPERSQSQPGGRGSPTSSRRIMDEEGASQQAMVRTKSGKKHKLSGVKKDDMGFDEGGVKKGKIWREQVTKFHRPSTATLRSPMSYHSPNALAAPSPLLSQSLARDVEETSHAQLEVVLELMHGVTSDRGADSMLYEMVTRACELTNAMKCIVFKIDTAQRHMFSLDADDIVIDVDDGIVGHAAVSCDVQNVLDVSKDERGAPHERSFELEDEMGDTEEQEVVSLLCMPVVVSGTDEVMGRTCAVIELLNKVNRIGEVIEFDEQDQWIIGHLAEVIAGLHGRGDYGGLGTIGEEGEEEDMMTEHFHEPNMSRRSSAGDLMPGSPKRSADERGHKSFHGGLGPDGQPVKKKQQKAIMNRAKEINVEEMENKVYEKTDAVREMIAHVLETNAIKCRFDGCSPDEKKRVIDAFEPVVYGEGQTIIEQGAEGDYFYVVESGNLEVYVHFKLVGLVSKGKGVGELAIIQDSPRAATIKAKNEARLWRISRDMCTAIVTLARKERNSRLISWLGSIRIGSNPDAKKKGAETLKHLLNEEKIERLVDQLEPEEFEEGFCIMRQGEPGDELYIIEEGEVAVYVADAPAHKRGEVGEKVATLGVGRIFGEKALLSEDKRKATLFATSHLKCLRLERDEFTNALGSLKEILQTNPSDQRRRSSVANKGLLRQNSTFESFDMESLTDIRRLGAGTFGRVNMVQHEKTKEVYALKSQSKAHIVEKKLEDRVLQEMRIMQLLNHPFILTLHGTMQDERFIYFVMELVPGGEMFTHLEQQVTFDEATAKFYAAQIMLAFEYMHLNKIVYRDLKPENVVLDKDGYCKLIDMGMAKKLSGNKTWTFCGTPDYLAPEIIQGQGHNKAVDYWALGIITFEMVDGNPPFIAEQAMETYKKIVSGDIYYPDTFGKNLQAFLDGLLAIQPNKRLGMNKNGVKDMKKVKWFKGFDFVGLENRTLQAPIEIQLENELDASYFDPPMDNDEEDGESMYAPSKWNPPLGDDDE